MTYIDRLLERLAEAEAALDRANAAASAADAAARHLAAYAQHAVAERDRLRAVVRKLVTGAGISLTGHYLYYAHEEYSTENDLTPDEEAAYREAFEEAP